MRKLAYARAANLTVFAAKAGTPCFRHSAPLKELQCPTWRPLARCGWTMGPGLRRGDKSMSGQRFFHNLFRGCDDVGGATAASICANLRDEVLIEPLAPVKSPRAGQTPSCCSTVSGLYDSSAIVLSLAACIACRAGESALVMSLPRAETSTHFR